MKLFIRIPWLIMRNLLLLKANEKYERLISLQKIAFV
jgi:hypothetical protein